MPGIPVTSHSPEVSSVGDVPIGDHRLHVGGLSISAYKDCSLVKRARLSARKDSEGTGSRRFKYHRHKVGGVRYALGWRRFQMRIFAQGALSFSQITHIKFVSYLEE